jgi:hypothetical protein
MPAEGRSNGHATAPAPGRSERSSPCSTCRSARKATTCKKGATGGSCLPRFAAQQAPAAEPDAGLCSASAGEQQSLRRQSVLLVRNSRRLDRRSPGFCSPPTAATPAGSVRWPLLVPSGSVVESTASEHRQQRGGAPRLTRLLQAPPASSDDDRVHRQRADGDLRSPRSAAPSDPAKNISGGACLRKSAILHAILPAPVSATSASRTNARTPTSTAWCATGPAPAFAMPASPMAAPPHSCCRPDPSAPFVTGDGRVGGRAPRSAGFRFDPDRSARLACASAWFREASDPEEMPVGAPAFVDRPSPTGRLLCAPRVRALKQSRAARLVLALARHQ